MNGITIKYKHDVETLVKVTRYLLFSKPYLYIYPFIFILILFQDTFLSYITPNYTPSQENNNYTTIIIILLFFTLFYFFFSFFLKKRLSKNKKNSENVTLTLNSNLFVMKGESYSAEYLWEDIYQIKETKKWFLIYLTKNQATPIPKEKLTDVEKSDLKNFFQTINIKTKLL